MENKQKQAKEHLLNIWNDETDIQFKPYHLLIQKIQSKKQNRAKSAKQFNKKTLAQYRQDSFNKININNNHKQVLKNTLQKLQQNSIQIPKEITKRIKTSINLSSKKSSFQKFQKQKTTNIKPSKFIQSNTYGIFSALPNFDQKIKILLKNKQNTFQDESQEIRRSIKRKLEQKQQKNKSTVQSKIEKITSFLNQNKNSFFQTKKNRIYKAFSQVQDSKKDVSIKSNKENLQKSQRIAKKRKNYEDFLANSERKLQKMGKYGSRKLTNFLY